MSKHLDFYYKCLRAGRMPLEKLGLCGCATAGLISYSSLQLFIPSDDEEYELDNSRYCSIYWASGLKVTSSEWDLMYDFTPLRQNIVLLMACLNGEFNDK
jgi:hypothetical protein